MTPAAEAVWEAFNEDEPGVFVSYADNLAAAIEALADQVVPEVDQVFLSDCNPIICETMAEIRAQILAIAKELKE